MAKVLIIEPDRCTARQYQQALEFAGHSVSWRQNAQEAINCADCDRPDVVVLELLLAGHNGVEFLYEFRSYSEWHTVPIIISSMLQPAHPGLSAIIDSQLGVHKYYYKPHMKLRDLLSSVAELAVPETAEQILVIGIPQTQAIAAV